MVNGLKVAVGLLLVTAIPGPAHAQHAVPAAKMPGMCEEWCFSISYPGGYTGYACGTGWDIFGD